MLSREGSGFRDFMNLAPSILMLFAHGPAQRDAVDATKPGGIADACSSYQNEPPSHDV